MTLPRRCLLSIVSFAAFAVLCATIPFAVTLRAQLGDLQAKVGDLKDSAAKNKEALAKYTWTERVTISLNGQQRKQERFQVHMGPDGKPVKTPIDAPAQDQSARGGRLRQRIVVLARGPFEHIDDVTLALINQRGDRMVIDVVKATSNECEALAPEVVDRRRVIELTDKVRLDGTAIGGGDVR